MDSLDARHRSPVFAFGRKIPLSGRISRRRKRRPSAPRFLGFRAGFSRESRDRNLFSNFGAKSFWPEESKGCSMQENENGRLFIDRGGDAPIPGGAIFFPNETTLEIGIPAVREVSSIAGNRKGRPAGIRISPTAAPISAAAAPGPKNSAFTAVRGPAALGKNDDQGPRRREGCTRAETARARSDRRTGFIRNLAMPKWRAVRALT